MIFLVTQKSNSNAKIIHSDERVVLLSKKKF